MVSLEGYKPIEQIRGEESCRVVRAESKDGTGPVVIKLLRAAWLSKPEARRSTWETLERWRQIGPQGFVLPINVLWSREGLVLVSPFVPAGSLEDRLREQTLSSVDVRQLAAEISAALRHAHGRGLSHGSLKPSNILFDEEGRVHITDFYLGGPAGDGSDYTAPEMRAGGRPTPASDQYSLALILLTVLSRKTPSLALDWLRKAGTGASSGSKATTRDNSILPSRVVSGFGRALQATPKERFPSLEAFHHEFEYGMGFATEPRPSPDRPTALATARGGRPRPKRRALLAPVLALFACLAISVPVLSFSGVGESFLDGVLRREPMGQTGPSLPATPNAPTPTTSGSADLQILDQSADVVASDASLPTVEPSATSAQPSQDPAIATATTDPLSLTPTATAPDSPTPAPTQGPSTPTTASDVNPHACNQSPGNPNYCTPVPTTPPAPTQ